MREASSRVLIEALWNAGTHIKAFDPVAMPEARRLYANHTNFILCETKEEALENADALAIVTEYREFILPDLEVIHSHLKQSLIFDGRNIYSPITMEENGILYFSIGRDNTSRSRVTYPDKCDVF